MKIEKFEDLDAWREARTLYRMIICATDGVFTRKDFAYVSQIRSAALSIMANIAEGFESLNIKENVNFVNFARRSCGEVRSHLYAGLDSGYLTKKIFDEVYDQTTKTGKIITGYLTYLRSRR